MFSINIHNVRRQQLYRDSTLLLRYNFLSNTSMMITMDKLGNLSSSIDLVYVAFVSVPQWTGHYHLERGPIPDKKERGFRRGSKPFLILNGSVFSLQLVGITSTSFRAFCHLLVTRHQKAISDFLWTKVLK